MDTAGGPAADLDEAVAEQEPIEGEPELLPIADDLSDMGVVPLSLLEAEAEAAADDVAVAPPLSLRDISPTRGKIIWRMMLP